MKASTLNTLLVAKAIYGETKYLVNSGDKHSCTAGIILLQDFVELIVLAVLDELDVNEQRSLESKSFDELLGELKRHNVPTVKSGTVKAMNKQRVIAKHYGQLASQPQADRRYREFFRSTFDSQQAVPFSISRWLLALSSAFFLQKINKYPYSCRGMYAPAVSSC